MFLIAIFGDQLRNMPRRPMYHKMENFLKQNFEKIGKNENRYYSQHSLERDKNFNITVVFVIVV